MTANDQNMDDSGLQQEIRRGRPFSLAEAIGREGGEFLKGYSPVPRLVQARRIVIVFISRHLEDRAGALQAILIHWVESDDAGLSQHIDQPLEALISILDAVLQTPATLHELTRQVAVKWGQMSDERPHFQIPGEPAHPDAEYSHESIHRTLTQFRTIVQQWIETEKEEIEE
ncbi:MAG: hypothetical protein AAFQ57_17745 [Cyanobacteria bacterium J06626_14]